MIEQLKYISVFWRDNEISISECANSVYEFLLTLKKHNNILFNEWYEKGGSKKEGLKKKVEISQEYLSNIVKKNWDKKKPHLGSYFDFWTGNLNEGYSASISIRIGTYGNKPHIKSSCVIDFPSKGEQMIFYQNENNRNELITLLENYWNPYGLSINGIDSY